MCTTPPLSIDVLHYCIPLCSGLGCILTILLAVLTPTVAVPARNKVGHLRFEDPAESVAGFDLP